MDMGSKVDVLLSRQHSPQRSKYPLLKQCFIVPREKIIQPSVKTPIGPKISPLIVSKFTRTKHFSCLAVGDMDGLVHILNTKDKYLKKGSLTCWKAHSEPVYDLVWAENDHRLVTASGDNTLGYWDVQTQQIIRIFKGHTDTVKTVCGMNNDKDVFCSGSRDSQILLWDVRSKERINCIKPKKILCQQRQKKQHQSITSVVFQKDGNYILSSGSLDGRIHFWDIRTMGSRRPSFELIAHDRFALTSLALDHSGTRLLACSMDNFLYQYDLTVNRFLKRYHVNVGLSFFIKAIFSPCGEYILAGVAGGGGCLYKVDDKTNWKATLWSVNEGAEEDFCGIDWSPHQNLKLAAVTDSGNLMLYYLH